MGRNEDSGWYGPEMKMFKVFRSYGHALGYLKSYHTIARMTNKRVRVYMMGLYPTRYELYGVRYFYPVHFNPKNAKEVENG